MPRTARDGLSRHPTKGYRIKLGKNAKGKPRTIWLGHDRAVADYHAHVARGVFDSMKSKGRIVWTAEDDAEVRGYVNPYRDHLRIIRLNHGLDGSTLGEKARLFNGWFKNSPPASAHDGAPAPAAAPASTPMLHAAIDAFNDAMKCTAVSASHKERTRQLLEDLKHYRADVKLADIDRVWLQTLTDEIKARPKARKRKTRLAPYTVRNTLRAWARFFDWLDANADSARFGYWQAPRRSAELFEVRVTQLMSKAERDAHADGPKQLTSEQVLRLYRAAKNDTHRICVLLGVFAALGQKEIASLRRDEFDLDGSLLTHRRNKTSQLGKYWLPPELVKLVRTYFHETSARKDRLAFVTSDGSPLVSETSDAIRQAWADIVDRVNKDKDKPKIEKGLQGFYHLRKFAADAAMKVGGPVLRDAFLAHAPATVGDKHYSNTRDFDAVFAVGRSMYETLKAGGMFTPVEQKKPAAA